jgi:hypothetical protein
MENAAAAWRARTSALQGLWWAGLVLALAGSAAVAVGAVLPWTRFTVFGALVSIPGVAGLGALSLCCGVLALLWARRLPLLGVLLGLVAFGIGAHAQQATGRAVKGRLLGLGQALAPVNDKLLRVGLPPVEPFELGRPWREFVGPGPAWTFWGGAALAVGSAAVFAGGRLRRSCPHCGAHWPPARAGSVAFCPACGKRVGPLACCPACRAAVLPGEKFCAACGVSLSR